jgi:FkbM family methyltransferase
MDAAYVSFYRIYCFFRERLALPTTRLPESLKKATRALLPSHRVSVRVRSGLSRGLWIRVRLPEEASYWQGKRDSLMEEAILSTVDKGSVVYDVGAHIGVVTLGTARLVGETGRVVAFDADPENIESLRISCALNHFEQRVQVVHAAVWSHTTDRGVSFRRGATRRSHGGVVADGHQPVLADGPTITVPSTTLDAFVESHGTTPKLVKIDVEGGEYEVLRGGDVLFTRARPLVIIEVHHADALERIAHWIESFHYLAQWAIPKQGFPRMVFAWPAESAPPL